MRVVVSKPQPRGRERDLFRPGQPSFLVTPHVGLVTPDMFWLRYWLTRTARGQEPSFLDPEDGELYWNVRLATEGNSGRMIGSQWIRQRPEGWLVNNRKLKGGEWAWPIDVLEVEQNLREGELDDAVELLFDRVLGNLIKERIIEVARKQDLAPKPLLHRLHPTYDGSGFHVIAWMAAILDHLDEQDATPHKKARATAISTWAFDVPSILRGLLPERCFGDKPLSLDPDMDPYLATDYIFRGSEADAFLSAMTETDQGAMLVASFAFWEWCRQQGMARDELGSTRKTATLLSHHDEPPLDADELEFARSYPAPSEAQTHLESAWWGWYLNYAAWIAEAALRDAIADAKSTAGDVRLDQSYFTRFLPGGREDLTLIEGLFNPSASLEDYLEDHRTPLWDNPNPRRLAAFVSEVLDLGAEKEPWAAFLSMVSRDEPLVDYQIDELVLTREFVEDYHPTSPAFAGKNGSVQWALEFQGYIP